jgi:hypothetical protein
MRILEKTGGGAGGGVTAVVERVTRSSSRESMIEGRNVRRFLIRFCAVVAFITLLLLSRGGIWENARTPKSLSAEVGRPRALYC